jgi:hypothetical protein
VLPSRDLETEATGSEGPWIRVDVGKCLRYGIDVRHSSLPLMWRNQLRQKRSNDRPFSTTPCKCHIVLHLIHHGDSKSKMAGTETSGELPTTKRETRDCKTTSTNSLLIVRALYRPPMESKWLNFSARSHPNYNFSFYLTGTNV